VDSGPLHLAAALESPEWLFSAPPIPPATAPTATRFAVLRSAAAVTTYKRGAAIDESMQNISPAEVFEILRAALGCRCS
jgi:ADP-heptose:LPS heptosyltransferase